MTKFLDEVYTDRISLRIKRTYVHAKHRTEAAMRPVSWGHTNSRLWPSEIELGMAPDICSIVSGLRLRTDGISIVLVASLYS